MIGFFTCQLWYYCQEYQTRSLGIKLIIHSLKQFFGVVIISQSNVNYDLISSVVDTTSHPLTLSSMSAVLDQSPMIPHELISPVGNSCASICPSVSRRERSIQVQFRFKCSPRCHTRTEWRFALTRSLSFLSFFFPFPTLPLLSSFLLSFFSSFSQTFFFGFVYRTSTSELAMIS